ncbi:hybrid sensor histidine kinase/response regulator transcription factor [Crocinitomix catalasitica]|uniref:hybrid sensor histidine kinase/response regulator transcription factor n=1 Tax=Crocinitomix catalasitica TaxID=184607 RepID=UPI0004864E35|nr:ATP-binding protein [Crocinitomix catalasitica]
MRFLFAISFICFITFGYSSENIDVAIEKAYSLIDTDTDSAIQIIQGLNKNVDSFPSEKQQLFFHRAAEFFHAIGDFKTEIYYWNQEIRFLPKQSDTIFKIIYLKSLAQSNVGDLENAFTGFSACKDYFERHNNPMALANAFSGLASVYGFRGDFKRSFDYHLKAIEIYQKLGNYQKLSHIHSNMGTAYFVMGDLKKSRDLRNKAYQFAKLAKTEFDIHFCEFNLADSYLSFDKTDSAIYYFQKARSYFEANPNLRLLNSIYAGLGACYSNLSQHKKANQFYIESIELSRKNGNELGLSGILGNYSRVLYHLDEFEKGINVASEGLALAKKIGHIEIQSQISNVLYMNYKGANKYDSALFYFEFFQMLADSINNIEVQKDIITNTLNVSHNKEKETLISESQNLIQTEKKQRSFWIAGVLILLTAAIFLIIAYRQKQKSTELINKEKIYLDNLLHNLVHEFRTPLTLIKGPTEELLIKDKGNMLLQMILKNSNQMLDLVNQVLEFAKIKAGKLNLNENNIELDRFIQGITALFQELATKKNISITYDSSVKSPLNVDADKLQKILTNLLSNAIKYSNDSGTIEIRDELIQNQLKLTVVDTGIGISKEDQKKVFNKFYQADASSTRRGEGTGIGLAFVKELVELMNGTIKLESDINSGTSITISIPVNTRGHKALFIREQSTDSLQSKLVEVSISNSLENFKSKRILIVEDNEDIQQFIQHLLNEAGYETYIAKDGHEGISMAEEIIPDVIVSDIMMPKMDGYQLLKSVKNSFPTEHIPVILLTAKASFDSMIDGLTEGADDYIAKPFNPNELLLRIANLINLQEKLHLKFANSIDSIETKLERHPLIEKIESLTIADISNQISVEELANQCALSRSQLHRKIKFLTGLSTSALMTKIRLDLAYSEITNSTLSIGEIAYQFGYNDPTNFTKLYKKQFQETPSETRKKLVK